MTLCGWREGDTVWVEGGKMLVACGQVCCMVLGTAPLAGFISAQVFAVIMKINHSIFVFCFVLFLVCVMKVERAREVKQVH